MRETRAYHHRHRLVPRTPPPPLSRVCGCRCCCRPCRREYRLLGCVSSSLCVCPPATHLLLLCLRSSPFARASLSACLIHQVEFESDIHYIPVSLACVTLSRAPFWYPLSQLYSRSIVDRTRRSDGHHFPSFHGRSTVCARRSAGVLRLDRRCWYVASFAAAAPCLLGPRHTGGSDRLVDWPIDRSIGQ